MTYLNEKTKHYLNILESQIKKSQQSLTASQQVSTLHLDAKKPQPSPNDENIKTIKEFNISIQNDKGPTPNKLSINLYELTKQRATTHMPGNTPNPAAGSNSSHAQVLKDKNIFKPETEKTDRNILQNLWQVTANPPLATKQEKSPAQQPLALGKSTENTPKPATLFDSIPLSRFRVESELGKGSFAIVKLAYDKQDNTRYALKIYQKYSLNDPNKLKNVKREISILKRIHHPYIIGLPYAIEERSQVPWSRLALALASTHSHTRSQAHTRTLARKHTHTRTQAHSAEPSPTIVSSA